MLESAHDCAEGGIAIALAESAIAGGVGFAVTLPGDQPGHVGLFSESASRAVVSVAPREGDRARGRGGGGRVSRSPASARPAGPRIVFDGLFEITVAEIAAAYEDAIPKLLAG